ncbi:uncharacterized protein LOC129226764 [Uloborus diversus]|uniref:uncharacterized protein LOC129226764 n=1 Tax=Uloborus diversus TaxID=327109 RepID=UPI0024095A09|nr:uncharacterized protein LOC129226764 [Uloborus diversus]
MGRTKFKVIGEKEEWSSENEDENGFRAAIKTDLNVSPAELVYGTSLQLPGDFFDEHSVIKSPETMIQKLRDIFHDFAPLPTKSHSNIKPFVSQDLKTCTHVFIRNDGVRKSLQPPYNGPYAVIKRGAKVFKVMIKGKNVTVSVDRLKPAFLSADKDNVNQPEEEMRKKDEETSYRTKYGRTVHFPKNYGHVIRG